MKFDSSRVAVVDHNSKRQVTLVRGMDPASMGSFDCEALTTALLEKGVDLAGRRLLMVNVIDNAGERYAWTPEAEAFGVDPNLYPASEWPPHMHHKGWDPSEAIGDGQWAVGPHTGPGEFFWWPFEGLPAGEDPTVYLNAPGWDFSGAVDLVNTLFTCGTRQVVYFHCMLGADRTGALHTGYLMKYQGMSLVEASGVADAATSANGPNADYRRLREAYAASIKR